MHFVTTGLLCLTMLTSWYGWESPGPNMANGERWNPAKMVAAHRHLPFGTRLLVEYEGRQVLVRVADRGPYVAGRHLDLSQGAAHRLGMVSVGVAPTNVCVLTHGNYPLRPKPI